MSIKVLALSEISVADRLRVIDEDWAAAIGESILVNGLMEPLVVRPLKEGGYALVAGAHRYRGLELIGYNQAECKVLDLTEAQARLAEIDENLMRRELTALDRAIFLAERKEVYEELHPETGHGKAPNGGKVANIATLRFTEDAAEKMGLSERTIQDAIALVGALSKEAIDALRTTPLAANAAQLKALAKLDADQQKTCAHRIAAGEFDTVKDWREAVEGMPPRKPESAEELFLSRMRKTWADGSKRWQDRFLAEIGAVRT